jgi:hypothetical protein
MDIRKALLAEHSRSQTMKVVGYIGGDPVRFAELMRLYLGNDRLAAQRAAWAVSYCVELHPGLFRPFAAKIIERLGRKDAHPAVRRNAARLLQFVDIPARHKARAFDACLGLVDDPREPVAVRAFAMTVAARIADGHPELVSELRLIVRKHLKDSTMAFCVRARSILA